MSDHDRVTNEYEGNWSAFPDRDSDPMWDIVRRVSSPLILDMGNRARRFRAWVRFGAVAFWFALALISGSPRWAWAIPWLVTVGITVLHAYRREVIRVCGRFKKVKPLAEWLLPAYSDDRGLNTPGKFDIAGNLVGGLAAGQFLGALSFMHVFDPTHPREAAAVGAADVLAAVVLIGGLSVALHHYAWHNQASETPRGSYTREWNTIAIGLTILILVLLWPGAVHSQGFGTRMAIDVAATVAAGFTAYYGRTDIRRRITYITSQMDEVKRRVRVGDSFPVHTAKTRVAEEAELLIASGHVDAGARVRAEALRLENLQRAMEHDDDGKTDDDGKPQSASDLYRRWLTEGRALPRWRGVVADLDATTLLAKDSRFMEEVFESFRSNAKKVNARDFEVSWTVHQVNPAQSRLVLAATCTCEHAFDGSDLSYESSLRRLERQVATYGGALQISEIAKCRHTFTMSWPTYRSHRSTPPTWNHAEGDAP